MQVDWKFIVFNVSMLTVPGSKDKIPMGKLMGFRKVTKIRCEQNNACRKPRQTVWSFVSNCYRQCCVIPLGFLMLLNVTALVP